VHSVDGHNTARSHDRSVKTSKVPQDSTAASPNHVAGGSTRKDDRRENTDVDFERESRFVGPPRQGAAKGAEPAVDSAPRSAGAGKPAVSAPVAQPKRKSKRA
jgi:hypothetical protein